MHAGRRRERGPAVLRPVLVVEDDRRNACVVALYLEEAGYRVVQVASGQAALEAASRELPLLVVLDLMLPDVGGEQVIQEHQALGDVPVIILTSRSSEEDRVVGFALGADGPRGRRSTMTRSTRRPSLCLMRASK